MAMTARTIHRMGPRNMRLTFMSYLVGGARRIPLPGKAIVKPKRPWFLPSREHVRHSAAAAPPRRRSLLDRLLVHDLVLVDLGVELLRVDQPRVRTAVGEVDDQADHQPDQEPQPGL